MVTEERRNTDARGARNMVVKKHAEHQVDGQDTKSGRQKKKAKIKERQKTWVGHVLSSGHLLQRVIEERIQGKPIRGRK